MFEFIKQFDLYTLYLIQENLRSPFLDTLMPWITYLGNQAVLWVILGLVLFLKKEHRLTGVMVFCGIFLEVLLVEAVLKPLVHRPRPFVDIQSIEILIRKPSCYFSFPSGHATTAFASAGILAGKIKGSGSLFISIAVLIAFSRLYLFVHYPSDVLTGVLLGLTFSIIVLSSEKRIQSLIKYIER
ncbi:MAG: phosphatase PAP2 family protein [Clostridia bacterium]|nr:phosphatase PAP2 family protein [Clostridia bacterium]